MAKLTALFIFAEVTLTLCSKDLYLTLNKNGYLQFDTFKKQANPYPELCKETPDMHPQDIHDLNMCILREKWNQEVVLPIEKTYSRRMSPGGLLVDFTSQRKDAPAGADEDCLYSQRFTHPVRPFPGVCRRKIFNKTYASDTWDAMWKEIGGDFSYMYDYVLWDKHYPEEKHNQLWFLILYLKRLVTLIPNPSEIINVVKETPSDEEFKLMISKVEAKLKNFNTFLVDAMNDALGVHKAKTIKETLELTVIKQRQPDSEILEIVNPKDVHLRQGRPNRKYYGG